MSTVVISVTTSLPTADVQDWGDMLVRMYQCWAVRHECTVVSLEEEKGNITTRVLEILGLSKGMTEKLRNEAGVHRLVRTSPFDPQGRRHTCFAAVAVGETQEDNPCWDERVRSYVLHPYQKVTDHRSGATSPAPYVVLDGHLEDFLGDEA